MIGETRRGQAATDSIERELAAAPTSVASGLACSPGRCTTSTPSPTSPVPPPGGSPPPSRPPSSKARTSPEALLGDLALEHELLSPTRLATMMPERLDEPSALKVLDRLAAAHTATIEWLMTRLGEIAIDAPPACARRRCNRSSASDSA